MKSRSALTLVGVLAALILLAGAFSAGFVAGRVYDLNLNMAQSQGTILPGLQGLTSGGQSGNTGTPTDVATLFAPFWQAWRLVHDEFVDQPVDETLLMRGALKGMLEALGDQHTSYLDPEHYQRSSAQLNGEQYEGIGAWVDLTKQFLTIISPMPGSPAEKAGLRPGDEVIAVDGEDMTGVDGSQVLARVKGPQGSAVRLTIRRPGQAEAFDVTLNRANITVPTVESKMIADNIAYVHLFTFGDTTARDLHRTLQDLLAQNPAGMVLDLRNNPGGYLDAGIQVASEFIGDGVIMYEEYGDGHRVTFDAKPGGLATQIPLVVLINPGSASASEIVAGAIQDRGRGRLVGEKSYGKGSVQLFTPLQDNQGAVRITTARWLTPNERQIHEIGLQPDVNVEPAEAEVQAGRDPQLEKAVELLVQK